MKLFFAIPTKDLYNYLLKLEISNGYIYFWDFSLFNCEILSYFSIGFLKIKEFEFKKNGSEFELKYENDTYYINQTFKYDSPMILPKLIINTILIRTILYYISSTFIALVFEKILSKIIF